MVKRPLLMICICLIALIFIWTYCFNGPPYSEALPIKEEARLIVTGQICQKEKTNLYLKSIQVFDSGTGQVQQINPKFKIICEVNLQESELSLGQKIKLSGNWESFSHASNPGQFDSANYYGVMYVTGKLVDCSLEAQGEKYWFFREHLYRLRRALEERLYRALPEKEASILAKMLLGEGKNLDKEVKNLYQRNGIVHILSISGLHITMIGMCVYQLLRKCSCPILPAAAIACIVLLLYGCMTGFSVSSLRAIGMFLIHMLGEITGRTYDMLTAIGLVMASMLMKNPRWIFHSGFLLSFASVAAIGCLYPVLPLDEVNLKKSAVPPPWIIRFLIRRCKDMLKGLWASAAISIFTLPITLYFFYEVPVYAPFINLLVIPFMGVVMVAGIGLMVMPDIPLLAQGEHIILNGYERVCLLFEKLPYHTWCPGRPEIWQIVIYYVGILAVLWLCQKKSRWFILSVAGLILLLGMRFDNSTQVSFLDVGQGDCIVVRTQDGRNYLFDGGSSSYKVAENIMEPFLKYHGVDSLDGVFISHPDKDHVSGILDMLDSGNIDISCLYLPLVDQTCQDGYEELLDRVTDQQVRYYGAGDMLEYKDLKITCLHPEKGLKAQSNVYSGCFLLEIQTLKILLTGDVESEGEDMLLEELDVRGIEKIHVLKVAHHGSKNSTDEDFLEQIKPSISVISCGKRNLYGHPHAELLERLEKSGSKILTTPESGAITVKVGKRTVIETWK